MPFITSDWHIHSVASYDASLHVADLVRQAEAQGLTQFGLTDHVNVPSWIHYLRASRELHLQFARPGFHFGVELTTISGYLEAYDRRHGAKDGYERPDKPGLDPIALPLTAEELDDCGVEFVVAAAHCSVGSWLLNEEGTQDGIVREMHRENLFCACSPIVDIVGHPYCFFGTYENKLGQQVPFDDFSIVPQSVHEELYAALRENGKAMEINVSFFADHYSEAWKNAYAEFARGAFERGIPVTIGTDCHGPKYVDENARYERWLRPVGFTSADFAVPAFGARRKSPAD